MGIDLQQLAFTYHKGRNVLSGIDLGLDGGQLVSLLGPNGSGKSTLLRLIGGFMPPTSGCIKIDGLISHSMGTNSRAMRLAYVPQQPTLAFAYDLASYVAFGRHALGRRDADRFAQDALNKLDLAHLADRPVGELSAGQRQRAAIARALCQLMGDRPAGCTRVLLADEPLSALDPRHALLVSELLTELSSEGVLVIAVLHDLALASRLSDRVVLLSEEGRVLASDKPETALREDYLKSAYGVGFDRVSHDSKLVALLPKNQGRLV